MHLLFWKKKISRCIKKKKFWYCTFASNRDLCISKVLWLVPCNCVVLMHWIKRLISRKLVEVFCFCYIWKKYLFLWEMARAYDMKINIVPVGKRGVIRGKRSLTQFFIKWNNKIVFKTWGWGKGFLVCWLNHPQVPFYNKNLYETHLLFCSRAVS